MRLISLPLAIARELRAFIALVLLCGLISPFTVTSAVAQEATGDVVAQGTLTGEGDQAACEFPKTRFGESNDSSIAKSTMILEITDDCQLVVTDVEKVPSGATTFDTWHEGAAWTEMHDCCGVVLTQSFAYMQCEDAGSSVYGGSSGQVVCRVFLDGWVKEYDAWAGTHTARLGFHLERLHLRLLQWFLRAHPGCHFLWLAGRCVGPLLRHLRVGGSRRAHRM